MWKIGSILILQASNLVWVSPGRIIVPFIWKIILNLTIRRDQSNISISFICVSYLFVLAVQKLTIIVCAFRQDVKFWLLIGWCLTMYPIHPISLGQTAWRLLLGKRNLSRGCWSLGKLHFSNRPWILNWSSIKCHEKKRQPFSLSGVRFGSCDSNFWVKICLALKRSKMSFPPLSPSITCRKQNPPNRSKLASHWVAETTIHNNSEVG